MSENRFSYDQAADLAFEKWWESFGSKVRERFPFPLTPEEAAKYAFGAGFLAARFATNKAKAAK